MVDIFYSIITIPFTLYVLGMDEDFESRHQWKGSNLGVTLYTFFDFFLCFIERFLSSLLIVIPQVSYI